MVEVKKKLQVLDEIDKIKSIIEEFYWGVMYEDEEIINGPREIFCEDVDRRLNKAWDLIGGGE